MNTLFNISYRHVGGLRFLRVGRFTFMWCMSRRYQPIGRPQ